MSKFVVKKNKAERYTLRICLLLISLWFIVALLGQAYLLALVLLPIEVFFGVIVLYLESWQIVISANSITKKDFLRTTGPYSYLKIEEVYLSYSFTDHDYLFISFLDKKQITFRLKDDNAVKAVKIIQSHKSIEQKRF